MLPICFEPFNVAQANLLLIEGNVLCQVCTLPESAAIAFSLLLSICGLCEFCNGWTAVRLSSRGARARRRMTLPL